jgi:hypothetical protein
MGNRTGDGPSDKGTCKGGHEIVVVELGAKLASIKRKALAHLKKSGGFLNLRIRK